MRSSKMDRWVQILDYKPIEDAAGGTQDRWLPRRNAGMIWAEKDDMSGREYQAAAQTEAEVTTVWKIRWRDDIGPKCRIRYDGLDYDIVHMQEIGRRDGLAISTRAAANAQG